MECVSNEDENAESLKYSSFLVKNYTRGIADLCQLQVVFYTLLLRILQYYRF